MKIKLLVLFVLGLSLLFSEYIDKIELHDGTIYRGMIILQKPGEYLKIETTDGKVIKIIIDDVKFISKEKVKKVKAKGETNMALYESVIKGDYGNVKKLLDIGANVNFRNPNDKHGYYLLHSSAKGNHFKITELLIDRGANIEVKNFGGGTTLNLVSQRGNIGIVKLLLDKGAKIEIKNDNGMTPLSLATMRGRIIVMKYLIKMGANVNSEMVNGKTILEFIGNSKIKNKEEVMALLVKHGAK